MTITNNSKTAVDILNMTDEWARDLAQKNGGVQPLEPDVALLRDAGARQTPEARLQAQVVDLDRLFLGLTNRAIQASDVRAADMLMRLALQCQRQTTRAVATLADITNKHRPRAGDVVDID